MRTGGRALAATTAGFLLAFGLATSAAEAAKAKKTFSPVESPRYGSIVIDAETGQSLNESGADERKYPASLTKMMTLYLTFDSLDKGKLRLDQDLPVSAFAAAQAPTKLGLRAGQTVMTEHCILGLVTKSANDCAVVLAESMGGTERGFANMMTDKAHDLGMSRTTFRNASGLPNDEQFSTARDMATLARALIRNHARHYHYFSRTSFTYKGVVHPNHNRLMARYDGMDGLKTGYIRASGFNLTASAVRNGRRLIAVVFGGPSTRWRDDHLASLLDRGFGGETGTAVASRVKAAPAPAAMAAADDNDVGDVIRTMASRQPGAIRQAEAGSRKAAGSEKPRPVQAQPEAAKDASVQKARFKVAEAAKPARGWGVQVGAYADRKASERAVAEASRKAPKLLDSASPAYLPIGTKKGLVIRARLMGLDEKTAKAVCAQLAKGGQKCHTVSPGAKS